MAQEMETFAARQASFDLVLQPEKRTKPIAWPHRRPSPAELAHAGFFYNPYETNPDNTTCFMCRRALDGWEEDDNPITEHLKHAKDCGWAIMMDIQQHSSNPAEIEDPTSSEIREARLATFGTQWPHDGKRGWVCDSEKMVDGGWYFCPTEESNDLASCAYCKLSLDGWEPQDDPFEEHYRRSSDCSFFVFAKPAGKKGKGSRTKKSRTSKASSRLSTQSTASEAPVSDIEDAMDQSIMSQTSTTTKKKGTKKSSKSKSKATKSKKDDPVETGSQMDVDEPEVVHEEPPKKRNTRGKKRTSEDVEQEEQNTREEAEDHIEQSERPAKKRATKARVSAQQGNDNQDYEMSVEPQKEENALEEEEPPKSRGTAKRQRGRKASTASTAPSTSRAPRDSELDAAIEADLDSQEVESKPETKKKQASTKSKSKKKQKATPEPVEVDDNDQEMPTKTHPEPEEIAAEVTEPAPKKTKSTKKGKKRGSENTESAQKPTGVGAQSDSNHIENDTILPDREPRVSVEIQMQEPEQELEQESESTNKKSSKKKASTEKMKKSKKAEKVAREPTPESNVEEPQIEETYQPETEQNEAEPETEDKEAEPEPEPEMEQNEPEATPEPEVRQESARRRSSKVPPKTVKRYSDIPQEQHYAESLAGSRTSDAHKVFDDASQPSKDQDNQAVSPLPSPSRSTPSLSPQSSDAENRPPSMKPTRKSHAPSPSKQPLAPSTPSPSKRNANMGGITTSHPWNPIDIDALIFANPNDPENIDFSAALSNIKGDLSSPEKKMTVEEWIMWNAKNGEERLKRECERLVGQFESEGARAMRVLEGIECTD